MSRRTGARRVSLPARRFQISQPWPGPHWVSFAIYSAAAAPPPSTPGESAPRIPRRSTGFHQFTRAILRPDGQKILDLGPTSSSNLQFITGLGHKAYNEDVLMAANASRLAIPGAEEDSTTVDVERFLAEELQYERSRLTRC